MQTMKLKNLEIEYNSYGENEGKYTGKIKYAGDNGTVEMQLAPGISNALLICIGQTLVEFAAKAAQEIQTNIIASVEEAEKPLLEAKTSEAE
jgi:hypothetical protein